MARLHDASSSLIVNQQAFQEQQTLPSPLQCPELSK